MTDYERIKELLKNIKKNCDLCMENTGGCIGVCCAWYDISSNAEKIIKEQHVESGGK